MGTFPSERLLWWSSAFQTSSLINQSNAKMVQSDITHPPTPCLLVLPLASQLLYELFCQSVCLCILWLCAILCASCVYVCARDCACGHVCLSVCGCVCVGQSWGSLWNSHTIVPPHPQPMAVCGWIQHPSRLREAEKNLDTPSLCPLFPPYPSLPTWSVPFLSPLQINYLVKVSRSAFIVRTV